MRARDLVVVALAATALGAARSPLEAQDYTQWNWPGKYQFALVNVLPFGQPVIPLYEGYYSNPDGTKSLSFGYFNMNLEETFDIPIGPDNFIEPAEFNGMQPTHFMAAPKERGRNHRHQSVFTITVPESYTQPIVWTIRFKGHPFVVTAHPDGAETFRTDDGESVTDSPLAAIVRFAPSDPPVFGRNGPVTGPLSVAVNRPLPLSVLVDPRGRPQNTVTWYHHQGPGQVTFSEPATTIKGPAEVTTTATFSEPGDYVIRVTTLESTAAMVQHCCWTNAYVKVTVTP